MSQVVGIVQADMGQTDPTKNDFVEGQAGAQATASATPSKSLALTTCTAGGITSTIITGANALAVLGNMDTQLAALTARLSQLEATLASGKIPNV